LDDPNDGTCGVQALLRRMWQELADLSEFLSPRPASWISARDAELACRPDAATGKGTPSITYDECVRICEPHGVRDQAAHAWASALRSLGS